MQMGKFLRKFGKNVLPFTLNRILLGCAMTIAPPLLLFGIDRTFNVNWGLLRATGWVYLCLLVLYFSFKAIQTKLEIRAEDKSAESERRQILRETAIFQAGLLSMFSAQASYLANLLEAVWHHWHNAGEVLLYPLDINLPKNIEDTNLLTLELRDFKIAYREHVIRVRVDVPAFTSDTMTAFSPSNREYVVVLRDLKEHSASLMRTAQSLIDSGIPLEEKN